MCSDFHVHKMKTRGECGHGVGKDEPRPGPAEKFSEVEKISFQKNKSKTMLIQHVKGYPDPYMYSKNKGGITSDTDCETPCRCLVK